MSWNARIGLTLAACLLALGVYVWGTWPVEVTSEHSALASPYCASIRGEANVGAQAAYVEELSTGKVIFAKNESAQLPFASLTKVMTVLVADKSLSPDNEVVITAEALTPEGEGLDAGELWRAEDLIDYTLIASVNDGAHALALAAAKKAGTDYDGFIGRMNDMAKEMGLTQTYFTNDTGLDVSLSVSGAYGSARDAAKMIAYAAHASPRLFERSTEQTRVFIPIEGKTHTAKNTSTISPSITGIIASKTGFTDLAGGNLAIVFEPLPGHPVAAAVLGSTREGRDADMEVLAETARRFLTRAILCAGD